MIVTRIFPVLSEAEKFATSASVCLLPLDVEGKTKSPLKGIVFWFIFLQGVVLGLRNFVCGLK